VLALAGALAAIALAGPRWGAELATVTGSGADVVLALDASLSMLATDEHPSRLDRMKQDARLLLDNAGGDRYGLIAFAGRSYILTPLTVDQGALALFLENLDPSVVGQAGSSLARAIRQGTDLLLATNSTSDRALVVMSDGEAFESQQEVETAAKRASDAGITLVMVGFGTTTGSTIPIRTPSGTSLKRDENGDVVVTHYSPAMLQAAATASGGAFIDAASTDKATRIRTALARLRRVQRQAQSGRDRRPRFQLFLAPAILLLLIDTLLAERRGRRVRGAAAATTATPQAAAVLLMLASLAVPAVARADDAHDGDRLFHAGRYADAAAAYRRAVERGEATPQMLYNLGTALMAAGRTDDAVAALEKVTAAPDLELRYRALFNLGLVHLQHGIALKDSDGAEQAFGAAVEAYKRALRLKPAELDAKWNYELANRQKKQHSGGGGGGGGGAPPPNAPQSPQAQPTPRPAGGLDPRQAEQILNSAAREERDVQGKKQRQNQPERPPGGKDW
jgi:Ca-activated chloride channel family protein